MASEENTFSPADYLYQGLPELLSEYDSLLIQLVVLHVTVWQEIHDQDQGMPSPPVEVWVETLRRIPTRLPNPLEELSCQAQDVERTDEIEEVSSDDEQPSNEQDDSEEQQQEQGREENPVDVDRRSDSPQFRIVDSSRVFDHPASAGFRYRRASGQQFRVGERRGPYIRRGKRRTGFKG